MACSQVGNRRGTLRTGSPHNKKVSVHAHLLAFVTIALVLIDLDLANLRFGDFGHC